MRPLLFGALTFAIVFAGTCFMGVVVRAQSSSSMDVETAPVLRLDSVGYREVSSTKARKGRSSLAGEQGSLEAGCLLGASPFSIRD